MRELVVIDDEAIARMLSDPRYTSSFPFLRQYSADIVSQNTGRCRCKAKARNKSIDYGAIKQAFANMDNSSKARLKELLQANKVRIIYRNSKDELIQMTF